MKTRSSILETMHPLSKRFKGADLSGHDITGWVFTGADMRECNLSGAYGKNVDLRCTNCNGCDMTGLKLEKSDATGASFRNAGIIGAQIQDTYLNSADLRGAAIVQLKTNIQGFHTRGVLIPQEFDPTQINGAHDCHELVAAMLRVEFPDDLEMLQITECIIARFIPCWHGLVERVRIVFPHREAELVEIWQKYNDQWQLADRWALGVAMHEAETLADWLALRDTDHYKRFPALVDGWIRKTAQQEGWGYETGTRVNNGTDNRN